MSVLATKESRKQETLKAVTAATVTTLTANIAAVKPEPTQVPTNVSFPTISLKFNTILRKGGKCETYTLTKV